MTRRSIRLPSLIGIIIALALLMAAVTGPALAGEAGRGGYRASPTSAGDELSDEAALACLLLVSGTALLAGIVCTREVRRLLS